MASSELNSAFLLHSRPYRNTSLLATFFTFEQGRVDAVARGVRTTKSKIRGLLQLFTPIVINWYGHGELVTLKTVEAEIYLKPLSKTAIRYGLYCNELLVRLLHGHGAHPVLYRAYEKLIAELSENLVIEAQLRRFEKILLIELGYALHLDSDKTGLSIDPDAWYEYLADQGPIKLSGNTFNKEQAFKGSSLLGIASDNYETPAILADAKRLMRYALKTLLGHKKLNTRDFFFTC